MKKSFVKNDKSRDEAIKMVMRILESLAWLYNCTKVQLEMGTIPDPYPDQFGYWQINRFKKFYLGKAKEQHMKTLPCEVQDLISESNG